MSIVDGLSPTQATMTCRSTAGVRLAELTVGKRQFIGTLAWPCHPSGFVLLAPGRGSQQARLQADRLASELRADGLGTLLVDLIGRREQELELQVQRLLAATEWLVRQPEAAGLPLGYLGIGGGARVALQAAGRSARIGAVVVCGGPPGLDAEAWSLVRVPTLFLEGDHDEAGLRFGAAAMKRLGGPGWLSTVPGAGPRWEETGTLQGPGRCAAQWFVRHLVFPSGFKEHPAPSHDRPWELPMFRTILVPLDGTRFAEAALPIALRLAKEGSSHLHLVLAHQLVPPLVGMGEFALPLMGLDEEERARETSYLANTATLLTQAGAGPVKHREVDGPAGPAVCEEARRLDAELVIMVTHGRGAAGRLWHGSVTDYVLRHGAPVLLVHPAPAKTRLTGGALRGILVALDLSEDSEAILEPVEKLARITGAPVTLLHVAMEPVLEAWKGTDVQSRLDAVAARLRARGLRVATRVTIGINAAWTLRDVLKESQFDLLAMTTHGAGGLRRLWMGSVADKMVRTSSKPVLVLRPSARMAPR